MITLTGKYTTAKIMIDEVEDTALEQIKIFIDHPAFTNPVAIMCDVHAGKSAVIGFTMKLTDKIVPATIGVDINCGMSSFNIGGTLNLSYEMINHKIRQQIPFGEEVQAEAVIHMKNEFPWKEVYVRAEKFAYFYNDQFNVKLSPPVYDMDWFLDKCNAIGANTRRMVNSLGSLGGGNHFIEVGQSTKGNYWCTVHTGSRNFGKRICECWQGRAARIANKDLTPDFVFESGMKTLDDEIARIKKEYHGEDIGKKIYDAKKLYKFSKEMITKPKSTGLEYLEGDDAAGYFFDMIFAQQYALTNRNLIQRIICEALGIEPLEVIETAHNFIDFHDFIIRKGAIRSYDGEKMIIPFNMRDGTLICEGRSNRDWNFSAPHGAGRILARGAARRQLSLEEFKKDMEGIYSTSVCESTIDESPRAYKDSKMIEKAIEPTAIIIDRIKPVINLKDAKPDTRVTIKHAPTG